MYPAIEELLRRGGWIFIGRPGLADPSWREAKYKVRYQDQTKTSQLFGGALHKILAHLEKALGGCPPEGPNETLAEALGRLERSFDDEAAVIFLNLTLCPGTGHEVTLRAKSCARATTCPGVNRLAVEVTPGHRGRPQKVCADTLAKLLMATASTAEEVVTSGHEALHQLYQRALQ